MNDSTERNTNCLEGFRCPKCGNNRQFKIEGTAMFDVFDDGTSDFGDVEWNRMNRCVCASCDKSGTVRDFQAVEHVLKIKSEEYQQIINGDRSYLILFAEDYRVRDRMILKETTPSIVTGSTKVVEKPSGNEDIFLISHINKAPMSSSGRSQWIVSLVPWDGLGNAW